MARSVHPPRKGWTEVAVSRLALFLDPVASLQEDNLEVVMSHAPSHPNNIRCHENSIKLQETTSNSNGRLVRHCKI